jgi:hypothetical protein
MTGRPNVVPAAFDPRAMGAGLATLGVIALAAAGYVTITTPQAQQCAIDLADARARLELLTEAKDACKEALMVCVPPKKESP